MLDRWTASLGIVLSIVCTAAQVEQDSRLRLAPAEIETLVRDALENHLSGKRVFERVISDTSRSIAIRMDLPQAGMRLSSGALPRHARYEFRLVSLAEAQAEADRTQQPFFFVEVDRPVIDGETATMWVGTDLTLPSKSDWVKTCCCDGVGHFRRVDGRWIFVKLDVTKCA
jgi:hypothetical protein